MNLQTTPFEDLILGSQFLPVLAKIENSPNSVGVLQCKQCGASFVQVRGALAHYKLHVFESHKQHFSVVAGGSCPYANCSHSSNEENGLHFHCTYCSFTAIEILELPLHMEKGHLAFYREVSLVLRGDDIQLKKVYRCGECNKKIQGTVSIVQHLLAHDSDGSDYNGCEKLHISKPRRADLRSVIPNGDATYESCGKDAAESLTCASSLPMENSVKEHPINGMCPTILNVPEVEFRNHRAVIVPSTDRNSMQKLEMSCKDQDSDLSDPEHFAGDSYINDMWDLQQQQCQKYKSPEKLQETLQAEINPLELLTTVLEEGQKSSHPFPEHFLLDFQAPTHFLADESSNSYDQSTEVPLHGYEDADQELDTSELPKDHSYFEQPGMFTCDDCHDSFKFAYLLVAHKRQVHQGLKYPFQCPACEHEFVGLRDMKKHILTHSADCVLQCLICQQSFPDKNSLKTHSATHNSGDRGTKCDSCGLDFPSKSELTYHIVKYQGTCNPNKSEGVRCATCGEEAPTLEALKEHRRSVHPPAEDQMKGNRKGFQCDYCGKTFNCRSNLRDHLVVHTGEKPYPCDICGKAFSFIHNMKTHRLTHNEGRNETCPYCDKAYKSKISLYYHMKKGNCRGLASTQVPEGYHRCPDCLQVFASEDRFKVHKEKGHCQVSYMCSLCGLRCTSQARLDKHIKKGCQRKVKVLSSASDTLSSPPIQDGGQGPSKRRSGANKSLEKESEDELACERCNYAKDCCCTFSCPMCGKRVFSILAFTLHKKRLCPSIKQRREKIKAAIMEKKRKREEEEEKLYENNELNEMADLDSEVKRMVEKIMEESKLKEMKEEDEDDASSSGSLTDLSTFTAPNSMPAKPIVDIEK